MNKISLLFLAFVFSIHGYGQQQPNTDTLNSSEISAYGKNMVKYNLLPTVLFVDFRNASLSYERVLKNNQSVSIGGGYLFLPDPLSSNSDIINVNLKKDYGFIAALDYRFYLKSLNTRPAPNGVYLAPYYSIYKHNRSSTFTYIDKSNSSVVEYQANLATNMVFHNFGLELGYQFIFFKHLSLDMILCGPAISYHHIQLDLESNLSADKKDELYQKYYTGFFEKLPIFQQIIDKGNFDKKGTSVGLTPNFRYTVQIGWNF